MEKLRIDSVDIWKYDCLESTNKTALAESDPSHLLTIVADTQTGGRGRMDRCYFSYNGGLYMSVVLSISEIKIPLSLCTPAAALSVLRALNLGGCSDIKIKWVNDLYKDNRKICGILTECRSEGRGIKNIIVGIGINLTEPVGGFPDEIENKAGIADYSGDKLVLAAAIANNLRSFIKTTPNEILSLYEKNMLWLGEKAAVTDYSDNNKKIEGTILGVNEDCFLRLGLPDGGVRLLSSGEIV